MNAYDYSRQVQQRQRELDLAEIKMKFSGKHPDDLECTCANSDTSFWSTSPYLCAVCARRGCRPMSEGVCRVTGEAKHHQWFGSV